MSTKNVPVEVVATCLEDKCKVSFHLNTSGITETEDGLKWFTSRSRIAKALNSKAETVKVGLLGRSGTESRYAFRANRTSIQIGCMRFSGENAKKLRLWAEKKRARA